MIPQILALTVNKGGPDGANVDIGAGPFIIGAMPFIMIIIFIIALFWYLLNKKRLEHQQIMAAIEKGTQLSELMFIKKGSPDWIKNITAGISSFIIGIGTAIIVMIVCNWKINEDSGMGLFFALIFVAIGTARLIRGILQHKTEKALDKEKLNH